MQCLSFPSTSADRRSSFKHQQNDVGLVDQTIGADIHRNLAEKRIAG